MDPETFRRAIAQGEFAVHWEAHGHCYGLRRSIVDDIRAGRTVVVNVSRTVVEAMRRAHGHVVVISITAPPEILAARLAARARTSDGQLAARLHRPAAAAESDVTIINIGRVEGHAGELVEAIRDARRGEPH
jgi:ribose 1,5-bisphosphokinase